jgi:DNA-binding FadR family transcriptional regulator
MAKVFHSLQRQNLSDQIVEQIGLSIMRNDLRPGDSLSSEPQLSLQFNVKRPVVREALNILRAKGLFGSRHKKGTRVLPRNGWNVLDSEVIAWLQAAEEAMRKLVILMTDNIHRALGHHPHSESERQDGSS